MSGVSDLQPQQIHGHRGLGPDNGDNGALDSSPQAAVARSFQVDRERAKGAGLDADRESDGGAFAHESGAARRGTGVVGQGQLSSTSL